MKIGWLGSIVLIFISSVAFYAHGHVNDKNNLLYVCGDAVDWPPYTYIDGNEVKGRDLDILDEVLPKLGYTYDITMTSWTRCLKGTRDGEFHIALSASFNDERAKHYLYSIWYYQITPYYTYSTKRFPEGLDIESVYDLESYTICGIHGYNYSDFKLNNINQYALNTFESITELRQLHCDVFLSWDEILSGIKNAWGIDYVKDDIVAKPIPQMEKHKFYMIISKNFPQALSLQQQLNRVLVDYRE